MATGSAISSLQNYTSEQFSALNLIQIRTTDQKTTNNVVVLPIVIGSQPTGKYLLGFTLNCSAGYSMTTALTPDRKGVAVGIVRDVESTGEMLYRSVEVDGINPQNGGWNLEIIASSTAGSGGGSGTWMFAKSVGDVEYAK
jgi:hypothetical protein